ncbi:hypothetical protein HYY71_00140 [Candidatus Woesearchaeota archaeon]|nr:hypothetical protein [Candidatus Woesearchaeota archaeon]
MTKNKLIWSFALVLLLSIPSVFAQAGIFGNEWVILIVNSLIVWIVLFVAQTFVVPEKAAKEKIVIWIITLVLAVVIAWNVTDTPGSHYIWQAGAIAQFFSIRILVNTALIAGAAYFGAGLLGLDPKTKQAQIGVALLAILIAGMIALNIGDKWLWDHENAKAIWDYLFEHETEKEVSRNVQVGESSIKQTYKVKVGGILRPEGPPQGQYRLFVFLGSALMFIWFFIAFGIVGNYPKLSYLIGAIIAANLARQGTGYEIVIKVAEILFFLILIKQIPADMVAGFTGGFAPIIRWGMAALLVSYIFCTVFQQSFIVGIVGKPLSALTDGKFDVGTLVGCQPTGEPVDKALNEKIEAARKAAEKAAGEKGRGIKDIPRAVWWGIGIPGALAAAWWLAPTLPVFGIVAAAILGASALLAYLF